MSAETTNAPAPKAAALPDLWTRASGLQWFNVAVASVILYITFTLLTGETFNTVNN